MTNKQKVLLTIVLIFVVAGIVTLVSIKKGKKQFPVANNQTTENTTEQTTPQAKTPDTTIEGVVISMDDKNIAINNYTPEPTLIGISATTPVLVTDKEGTETEAGLANVTSGETARVYFKEEGGKKVAQKIVMIQK